MPLVNLTLSFSQRKETMSLPRWMWVWAVGYTQKNNPQTEAHCLFLDLMLNRILNFTKAHLLIHQFHDGGSTGCKEVPLITSPNPHSGICCSRLLHCPPPQLQSPRQLTCPTLPGRDQGQMHALKLSGYCQERRLPCCLPIKSSAAHLKSLVSLPFIFVPIFLISCC